jgi:hypothetical protein
MGMIWMFTKKAESIKFGDFMSGEYNRKREEKQRQNRAILKATTRVATLGIVATTTIPMLAVAIPMAGIQAMASTGGTITTGQVVAAGAMTDAVKERIVHAFDPLVDLMVALSLPIAGVMITGGALLVMIGQKDAGFKLIMNSSLGYVLVQMSPMLIDLLFGVGGAI